MQRLWLAGVTVLFGTTCQGPHRGRARALVLGQGRSREEPIRILAFGDSYASYAPGTDTLIDTLARYNRSSIVYNAAVGGTRSCQWSDAPWNLRMTAAYAFGGNNTDYIWLSIGGNDQKYWGYRDCIYNVTTFEETRACVVTNAIRSAECQSRMVNMLFDVDSHAKVFYSGYDFSCKSDDCMPVERYPICGMDFECYQVLNTLFQDIIRHNVTALVPPEHEGRYVAFSIEGTLQQAAGMNATPGNPIRGEGSPCSLLSDCHHPEGNGAAAWYLGEAFVENFFREELRLQPHHQAPPRYDPLDTHLIGVDEEEEDARCNQDWAPDLEDPACPAPPCHRGHTDWLGKRTGPPVSPGAAA